MQLASRAPAGAGDVRCAVAILAAAACFASAGAAQAAERVARGASTLMSDGRTTAVFRSGPTSLSVRGGAFDRQDFEVPSDCEPQAVSRAAVALRCAAPGEDFVPRVLTFADAALRPVPAAYSGWQATEVLGIGRRWLLVSEQAEAGVGRIVRFRSLIDWRSGRRIDLRDDPYGPRRVLTLDRAEPARRLCRPLRRGAESESKTRFGEAVLLGRWLMRVEPIQGRPVRMFQRCGDRRPSVTLPIEYPAAFNGRYAAYVREGGIRLVRLSGRRRRVVRTGGAPVGAIALTSTHLYYTLASSGPADVFRVRLPAAA